jgi:hypothetical protein
MTPRAPHDVLVEWRSAERELDEASDPELREAIQSRIAALAAEHRAALDERTERVDAPSRPPAPQEG